MDVEIDRELPIEIDRGDIGNEFVIDLPDISVYEEEQCIDIESE